MSTAPPDIDQGRQESVLEFLDMTSIIETGAINYLYSCVAIVNTERID